jgi:uncharacterized membrane protein YkoI
LETSATTHTKGRHMTDKVKNIVLGVALLAAFALGGAAIAGAAQDDNATSRSNSSSASSSRPQRSDETLLTGETATRVREAALARVPGGTIERVETDADGHATYEAHMIDADGNRVTVYVNAQFEIVSVDSH